MSNPIKPSTIRRLTRLAKTLRQLMKRVPNALPKPGSPAYSAHANATASDAQKRQEQYNKMDAYRLDKSTIRFFASAASFETDRR
jgi:hypothetical protein